MVWYWWRVLRLARRWRGGKRPRGGSRNKRLDRVALGQALQKLAGKLCPGWVLEKLVRRLLRHRG